MMRILVLGGTSFVGRAIVEDALSTGAEVTLFGRGRTGTDLFPQLTRLIGDRDSGDYAALRDGEWDAVVDVSGYVPRHVGQAMDALGDRMHRYLFISSHAVYLHTDEIGTTEDAPRRPPVRDTEELTNDTYGPLKVACEDDVLARYAERATIVRPGKVAGPHDNQDGLTYWVRRAARGGPIAVPADPAQPGSPRHEDLAEALDSSYQDRLERLAVARRAEAEAAELVRNIKDQIAVQGRAAEARQLLPAAIEAEKRLREQRERLRARIDAFRARREVLEATYTAARAELAVHEVMADQPGDDRGELGDPAEAVARLRRVTAEIERELAREPRPEDLLELRPGPRSAPWPATSRRSAADWRSSPTSAANASCSADPGLPHANRGSATTPRAATARMTSQLWLAGGGWAFVTA